MCILSKRYSTCIAFVGLTSVVLSTLYRKKQIRIECNVPFWVTFWTYVATERNYATKPITLHDDDKDELHHMFNNIYHSLHIYRPSPCVCKFASRIIHNHLRNIVMRHKPAHTAKHCDRDINTILHQYLQTKPLSILFPLCGSTYDMLYISHLLRTKYHLPSHLFTIIGIESSATAITHFFTENDLVYQHSCYNPKYMTSSGFYRVGIYSSQEHSIRIMQSDIFEYCDLSKHLSSVGIWRNTPCFIEEKSIDIVMDINAMSCIDPSYRKPYSDAIKYWLAEDGSILLNTVWYDPKLSNYPPFTISPNDIHKLFENNEYKLLRCVEGMGRVSSISQSWLIKR